MTQEAHPNASLIQNLYGALGRRDGETMAACYHDSAVFSDPVFTNLNAAEVRAMWRMLCERGSGIQITVSDVSADATAGKAHWEPVYTFSKTGLLVHNKIDSVFEFREGKIAKQADSFDLWRWAGMALGIKGKLLGWMPGVQNAIRREARKALDSYMSKR